VVSVPSRVRRYAADAAGGVRWQSDYWISGLTQGGMRVSALRPYGAELARRTSDIVTYDL
jgi:hypothetical protein